MPTSTSSLLAARISPEQARAEAVARWGEEVVARNERRAQEAYLRARATPARRR